MTKSLLNSVAEDVEGAGPLDAAFEAASEAAWRDLSKVAATAAEAAEAVNPGDAAAVVAAKPEDAAAETAEAAAAAAVVAEAAVAEAAAVAAAAEAAAAEPFIERPRRLPLRWKTPTIRRNGPVQKPKRTRLVVRVSRVVHQQALEKTGQLPTSVEAAAKRLWRRARVDEDSTVNQRRKINLVLNSRDARSEFWYTTFVSGRYQHARDCYQLACVVQHNPIFRTHGVI